MGLLQRRTEIGLTQEAVAKKVGVSLITIGRYERGERRPTVDILPRYAAALDCSVEELLEALPERKRG